MKRRHLVVPDCQVKPGVPTEHLDWAGRAILEYKPDVVVVLGDFWDMHSLSGYDAPGSVEMEGARYLDDVRVGNEAFGRLIEPMRSDRERRIKKHRTRWDIECHFLIGNHEDRITRAIQREPKYIGAMSLEQLQTPGFRRHGFLEIIELDGIFYSHYFSNSHSGRPIGGSIPNRLNRIGRSFVQGHEQGFSYGCVPYPGRLRRHGLVVGSFYQHVETYRGAQAKDEWRGIVVLNEVEEGSYDIMPLSMDYLRKKYA
jgi:hypothetical protein